MDNLTTISSVATTLGDSNDEKEKKGGGVITEEQLIVITVMLSLFSVVGTFGNALAIYVFAKLKQKVIHVTSTIFILTLAGTDFITCLITIPFTVAMETVNWAVTVDVVCKFYHFLITTTVPFSCMVIVAIAVDRYMCICHPFHHWMTTQRARIIIGVLAFVISIFGTIVCMHYSIYLKSKGDVNTTTPGLPFTDPLSNGTTNSSEYRKWVQFSQDSAYMAIPFTSGPEDNQDYSLAAENRTSDLLRSLQNASSSKKITVFVPNACDVNAEFINARFYAAFQAIYSAIFLICCVIVLVLYSLIYRSVIAQRRKKLRIKTAQCCLLWNASSIDATEETVEMTQDIELSQVNGDERSTPRQNSSLTEDQEPQNNGLVRKCSLSKARIERMRVANIKTAFTLFIVTLVFIIVFLPAWLMALQIVNMNVIIFYMHYAYNVANPFIYAFLNQNFKTELRRIFRCENQ